MEKILLAIDAEQMDIAAVDFACYIAGLTRSKLTGVFVENVQQEEPVTPWACSVPRGAAVYETTPRAITTRPYIEGNIQLFEEACKSRGIRSEVVLCNTKLPAQRIIAESRFADLLIVKAETSFDAPRNGSSSHFTNEVLAGAECPVIIAPNSIENIDEIIFTYDGSHESVFAIKQFTYLFPQLSDKKVIVLEVTDHEEGEVTAKEKIRELMKAHYSGIGFQVLHGKTANELFAFLLSKKNSFVVTGTLGKNIFSRAIRQSTTRMLLRTINCPFFVAHY